MIVKQVTVRVENKEGKLKEVLDVLAEKQINVEAISMADTVTRLILSNPEEVVTLLTENGFHAELTDVIRLTVPSRAGALAQMLSEIAAEKINLEYMYAVGSAEGDQMIIYPSDLKRTEELLSGFEHTGGFEETIM